MRLQLLSEIIQTKQETKNTGNVFDRVKAHKKNIDREFRRDGIPPRSGWYSRVYNTADPHMIAKTNHVPIKATDDAYLNYIRYIVDNKLAEKNPFFPRIYGIKYFKDAKGYVKYKIEMEKLHGLSAVKSSVLIALLQSLFPSAYYNATDDQNKLGIILAHLISEVMRGYIVSEDNLLNDAGAVIRRIRSERTGKFDMHRGNLMIRLSPIPQLVIIDPLSN